jgi:hypothetical protein
MKKTRIIYAALLCLLSFTLVSSFVYAHRGSRPIRSPADRISVRVISHSKLSKTHESGKLYALCASATPFEGQITYFTSSMEKFYSRLVDYQMVNGAWLVPQATEAEFLKKYYEICQRSRANDSLVVFISDHGIGYSKKLEMTFDSIIVHNDPNGEIDAFEWACQVAANSINHLTFSSPLGLNSKSYEFIPKPKSDTAEVVYIDINGVSTETFIQHNKFFAYGLEFIPLGFEFGQTRGYIGAKRTYLRADNNQNGIIGFCNFPEYGSADEKELDSFQNDRSATDIVIDCLVWGLNANIDHNGGADGQKDQIFWTLTNDGPRMACDLNCPDTTLQKLQVDLLDLNNDGVFDFGDFNGDGDINDYLKYRESIIWADGQKTTDEEFYRIFATYPGSALVIFLGSCYGSGMFPEDNSLFGFAPAAEEGISYVSFFEDLAGAVDSLYSDYQSSGKSKTYGDLLAEFLTLPFWDNLDPNHYSQLGPFLNAPLFGRVITVVEKYGGSAVAKSCHLAQNYPNPFNETTIISFDLVEPGQASLVIYDMLGREVAVLLNNYLSSGSHRVLFNGAYLPSGAYLYILRTSAGTETKQMILQH